MEIPSACDYLIVGGGSAGCILARRLAETGSDQVLLLEAGPSDEGDPVATELARLDEQDDSYDWGYLAQPTAASRHAIRYDRARMLGGCGNHNDCAFLLPPASDFETWVTLGASGWDAAALASAQRRLEQRVNIEASPVGNSIGRAFIDACTACGLPEINYRETINAGTGWFPLNADGPLRQSASIAYLHPLDRLPANLQVLTGTLATALVIEAGRVTGVDTDRGRITVRREVILCAGAINTPQLLMLSGIGPGEELQGAGIPPVVDLPGVGRNLLDHVAGNIACEMPAPPPAWARTPCEAVATIRVDPDAPAPDVLYHFIPTLRDKYSGIDHFDGVEHGLKISPNVARPKSRGRLSLSGNSIHDAPKIDLDYFSDPEGYDLRILVAGLRFARRLAAVPCLAQYISREILPGPQADSDAELADYLRDTCETVYHPSGTCRIGKPDDPLAVVTPDLRVRGIDGLRIADAAVFPSMVTVNINNTVMLVAERAAELIKAAE